MKKIKAFVKLNSKQKIIEAQTAIEIILANGKIEEPADGIIYMSNIEDAFRIKTGDSLKRFNL